MNVERPPTQDQACEFLVLSEYQLTLFGWHSPVHVFYVHRCVYSVVNVYTASEAKSSNSARYDDDTVNGILTW